MNDDHQDLLLIQENDDEDLLSEESKINSKEAIKSNFHEFKKSFTHNELLKLRKKDENIPN